MKQKHDQIPPDLVDAYEAERRRKTVEAVWGVTIIALLMYPATTALDWLTFPQVYRELSIVRFSETGALIALLVFQRWLIRTGRAERLAHQMAWVLAGTIVASLDLFIVITGGPGSLYYGGLTLLLTAVLVAYPWGLLRMAALVVALVLQFNGVLLLADEGWRGIDYFVANYFYVGTIFIGLVWRLTGERLSRQEFLQRNRVEVERANLEVTLRAIADGVITTDDRGCVVLVNRVAEELTGWSQDEGAGRPLPEVLRTFDEATLAPWENPVSQVLATGEVVDLAGPVRMTSRQGSDRLIEQSSAPIRCREGKVTGAAVVFRDVTRRRRMEEDLLRAHKLDSVGLLAGGIAHDFNNLLTAIWGNVSLARSVSSTASQEGQWLSEAENALSRARALAQQLLTFAKGGAPIRKPTQIRDLIADTAAFSLRGSNVRCEVSIPQDLWPVEVDASQIRQVLSHLVINADEAMPDGGTIRVSARNLPPAEALSRVGTDGKFIEIVVQDEGVGISPEDLPRVFDPYFTTKKQGSGLGLALSYAIVQKHDGRLTVESRKGRGSTLRIHLPASTRPLSQRPGDEAAFAPGHGRGLVMDDDDLTRNVCMQMLTRLGYEVQPARDGAEALRIYGEARSAGRPFDFVIMDLTVPGGMGGREAVLRLLELDPTAKAIVSSGYSTDPIMADHRAHGFRGVLEKPFDLKALGSVLQEVLAPDAE